MKKNIGLFGGTFDPIHWGHINLALEIKEKRELQEVWFCPTSINPHKLHQSTGATANQRWQMLNLTLEKIPGFRAIDIEIKRQGPSFTIDTVKQLLMENEEQCSFSLIIGEDAAIDFHNWRQADEIVKLVPIWVGSRLHAAPPHHIKGSTSVQNALTRGWTTTRVMEISATEIRQRVKQGLYCRHLIPPETIDYICKNQLYL